MKESWSLYRWSLAYRHHWQRNHKTEGMYLPLENPAVGRSDFQKFDLIIIGGELDLLWRWEAWLIMRLQDHMLWVVNTQFLAKIMICNSILYQFVLRCYVYHAMQNWRFLSSTSSLFWRRECRQPVQPYERETAYQHQKGPNLDSTHKISARSVSRHVYRFFSDMTSFVYQGASLIASHSR